MQLADLAAALEVAESVGVDVPVAHLVGTLRRFLIPRLADPPPPLVVAVVGSTGSGKSTLVNSLAGSPVTVPGVLRPTTSQPIVWTGAAHAGTWWPWPVVVGDHPLAGSVALIDTPDLDSDAVDHRLRAIEALSASDAVVFVTTSSRYGDASPWEVLRSVVGKPMAVVVNRLQTRASGARNDLTARLQALGMGEVPVLTISEQRIDPGRGRLGHQSVQRLGLLLREWASDARTHRVAALEATTDQLAGELARVIADLEDRSAAASRAIKDVSAAYEVGWESIDGVLGHGPRALKRILKLRRRDLEATLRRVVDAVDSAAMAAAAALASEGFQVPPDLRSASTLTVSRLMQLTGGGPSPTAFIGGGPSPTAVTDHAEPTRDWLALVVADDRQRFLDRLELLPEGLLERLHNGAELISDLDWRNV